MRFDRLDLNLLVALDVLLETRSVSEAARRLYLSQPAVTGALKRLREFFEDDLLVQSGRRMLLTRRAEDLISPVKRALALIRSEITSPDRFEPETATRRFLIAASDYAYTILIADVMARAAIAAPGVSFELITPGTHAAERFSRAELDLFLTVEPMTIAHHPQSRLWRDEEVIISWAGADHNDHISADAFFSAGHAVALFGPDRQPSLSDAYLQKSGPERRVEVLLPSFSSLPQAIVGTRRLATMHRLLAEHFAQYYPIRLHRPWIAFPEVVETVQWHQVRATDPGLKWMLDLFAECLQGLPAHAQI